jgi:hypothetical protein
LGPLLGGLRVNKSYILSQGSDFEEPFAVKISFITRSKQTLGGIKSYGLEFKIIFIRMIKSMCIGSQ